MKSGGVVTKGISPARKSTAKADMTEERGRI